ncbi:uncharacterized protein LOC131943464 [Physella acuta]|uniref:uncharacterized protein LOC131943464 n=1 Tax=Physella acuta TaxID=109671 RepID=UPI0027DD421D|nr:uncharacterized protein LOC131943464 [Physella acuta]
MSPVRHSYPRGRTDVCGEPRETGSSHEPPASSHQGPAVVCSVQRSTGDNFSTLCCQSGQHQNGALSFQRADQHTTPPDQHTTPPALHPSAPQTFPAPPPNVPTNDHIETLYVIRSSQLRAPHFKPNVPAVSGGHVEAQPAGTSTPINQSPAVLRRFVPENQPSPLPIPRRHHHRSQPYIFYTGSQSINNQPNHGCAPIARLDCDYF